MPITVNGYNSRKFSEILSSINTELQNNVSPGITTSPETQLGILQNIFAEAATDVEELLQSVVDNLNVDKAEGKFLEDIAAWLGFTRRGETATYGYVQVTGEEGSIVPPNSVFLDQQGNEYQSSASVTIESSNVFRATYEVLELPQEGDYINFTGTVDGKDFTFTYSPAQGGDNADVARLLSSLISSQPTVTATLTGTAQFTVESNSQSSLRSILIDPNDYLSEPVFAVSVPVTATEKGPTVVGAYDIVEMETTMSGFISVENTLPFTTGTSVEDDEAFRARVINSGSTVGYSSVPALIGAISELSGVLNVSLESNNKTSGDIDTGLPGNSYEVIVRGGDDGDIANAIFERGPVGIQTVGSTSVAINYNDKDYIVKFSRPTLLRIFLYVTYTIYDEETFVDTGETAIKEVITDYINNLENDVDFIPKRAYGSVYAAVDGIEDLVIKAAVFESEADFENAVPSDFTGDTIAISKKELATTSESWISIVGG